MGLQISLGDIALLVIDQIKFNEGMKPYAERKIFDWGGEERMPVSWDFLKAENCPFLNEGTLIALEPGERMLDPLEVPLGGVDEISSRGGKKAFKFIGDYSKYNSWYCYHLALPRHHYFDVQLICSINTALHHTAEVISRKQTQAQNVTWDECSSSRFLVYFFGPDPTKVNTLLENEEMKINHKFRNTKVNDDDFSRFMDPTYLEVKEIIKENLS